MSCLSRAHTSEGSLCFRSSRALVAPALAAFVGIGALGSCSHPEHSSDDSDDTEAPDGVGTPQSGEGDVGAASIKPGGAGPLFGDGFVVDRHAGGAAAELALVEVLWGRLVDVYDTSAERGAAYDRDPLDPAHFESRLVYPDFLIDADLATAFEDGTLRWELFTHPVTGDERLRIGADAEREPGAFALLLAGATAGLEPLEPKGRGAVVAPPFSVVPRNAALALRFDDLLDPGKVATNDTLRVHVGDGLAEPFGARVFPDPNHGGIAGGRFASTRIIVDFAVSATELARHEEPLSPAPAGLPEGVGRERATVAVTLPTRVDPASGQFAVLTNLAGAALTPTGSGPVSHGSPTVDVTWCFGTGGSLEPFGGLLPDVTPPRVVGREPVTILTAASVDPSKELRLVLDAAASPCLFPPRAGDVVRVGDAYWAEVVAVLATAPQGPVTVRVAVPRDVTPLAPAALAGAAATYETPWRPSLGVAAAPCFIEFTPAAGQAPNALVDPDAHVRVHFNEAVDGASAQPYDSFYVARAADVDATLTAPDGSGAVPPLPQDLVLGAVSASADGRTLTFIPSLPLTHASGQQESYWFNLVSDLANGGVTDLAGNVVADPLPPVPFTLDPAAPDAATDGWVLRFNAVDEDGLAGPEVRGQVLFDLTDGVLLPRPVQRFAAGIDRTQPVVDAMVTLGAGLQTPLSPLGSKTHLMWRYMDAGFQVSQTDDSFYNLDVEGLALAPVGGQVIAEVYPEFELRLGHATNLPDEVVSPHTLLPEYPQSGFGIGATFDENSLADPLAGPVVVHPRALGFSVSPGDVFLSAAGTPLLPLPWNQGVGEDRKTFYTWRDTAIQTRGNVGPDGTLVGAGAPTTQEHLVTGLSGAPGDVWGDGPAGVPVGVPAPGLPLLMEYRCYPTDQAVGLTAFDVSLAVATSPRPFLRAFSTGGVNQAGQVVVKDPDLEATPSGGFNASPQFGPLGAQTAPRDPTIYIGQMDVVLRISRAYTVLVDAAHQPFASASGAWDYAALSIEPAPAEQPAGTAVTVAWRGSDIADLVGHGALTDASRLDVFGEPLTGPLSDPVPDNPPFPWADASWKDSLDALDGQRFVQSRLTFVSNTATLSTPSLDAYGLAYFE